MALKKYGNKVGVVHLNLRSLRQWRSIFSRKYGTEIEIDAGLATFRCHGMAWFPRMPFANRCLWLWQGRRLIQKYIQQHGFPDVIHVHSMLSAGHLSLEIKQHWGIPYVVTEHSSAYARGVMSPQQIQMARNIAQGAHRRFAVSLPLCEFLFKNLGCEAGVWEVMPNMVERRFMDRPLPTQGKMEEGFRFIAVALLTPNKGMHILLQSFAQAFSHEHRVVLDIGGNGPERPKLEALARDLGIQDRVRFLGALSRDQVADAIASANAFVLASNYETFGVVVVEALALGKPVIATRCGGPETIIREQDGVLVPTGDVYALSHAMRHMRRNPNQYVPGNLRASCRQRYGEESVVNRLTQVYEEVASVSRVRNLKT